MAGKENSKYVWLVLFILLQSTCIGQDEIGANLGYLKPVFFFSNDTPNESSIPEYHGSFYARLKYLSKATNKMFLGINLGLSNYHLDYDSHKGSHAYSNSSQLNYKFSYLQLDFYPEWVFGKKFSFFFNTGISLQFLLNSHKEGSGDSWRVEKLPDGTWQTVYNEYVVDESARDNLKNFSGGLLLGYGVRYNLKTNWNINFEITNRFSPFPIESEVTRSQFEIFFSAGVSYIIKRDKDPILLRQKENKN